MNFTDEDRASLHEAVENAIPKVENQPELHSFLLLIAALLRDHKEQAVARKEDLKTYLACLESIDCRLKLMIKQMMIESGCCDLSALSQKHDLQ